MSVAPQKPKTKAYIWKSNHGLFIRFEGISGWNEDHYRLNGKVFSEYPKREAKSTSFLWLQDILDENELFLEVRRSGGTELDHFTLKVPSLESERIPLTLQPADLHIYYDEEEEDYKWTCYEDIRSLYSPVHKALPPSWEALELEPTIIGEFVAENITEPVNMRVRMMQSGSSFSNKPEEVDLKSIATWEVLEQLLTSPIMLHERPCHLTSETVFRIVRAYLLENIDPKQARVDSNYTFCFSVNKQVVVKPYKVKREKLTRNGNSYRPPRFTHETHNTKSVRVFEMTWQGAGNGEVGGYGEYTCIPEIHGRNLQELADNLKRYLDELVDVINTPVAECPHCNGTGHVVGTPPSLNKEKQ